MTPLLTVEDLRVRFPMPTGTVDAVRGVSFTLGAEKLGIVPSSLTFHLQQLVHAGLITQRRSSRHIIYAANFATISEGGPQRP